MYWLEQKVIIKLFLVRKAEFKIIRQIKHGSYKDLEKKLKDFLRTDDTIQGLIVTP